MDTTICDGEKIILSANTTGTYTWNTNESSSEIEIEEPGIYSLEIENSNGCLGNDSMELFVQDLPIVNLGNDTTICRGETIVFDTKQIEFEQKWNTGDSTSQITVNYEGIYNVKVTDNIGCYQFDSIELFINELPNLSLGNDTSICEGQSINLTGGNIELNHLWNTSQTINSIDVFSTGTYSVFVTDSIGCSNSDSIKILVNELPIVNIGNDTSICEGESIDLHFENIEFNLQWNTGDTTSNINVQDGGIYSIEVIDSNGCINSDSLTLVVNEPPTLSIGNDTTICEGQSVVLKAVTSASEYLWNTGKTTQEIIVNTDNFYSLEVKDSMGCIGIDSIKLSVKELPTANLGNDTTICEGKYINLKAYTPGASYLWSTRESGHSLTVFDAGTYSVAVSDNIGCTKRDTIEVMVRNVPNVAIGDDTLICSNETLTLKSNMDNNDYDLTWSTGSKEHEIIVDKQGLYKLNVMDDFGCIGRDEIYVSQEILPDPFTKKAFSFCEGSGLELSPDAGFENIPIYWLENKYSSTLTVFESGIYSGIVEGNFCVDTTKIYVTKIDTPDAKIKDVNSKGHYCFEYESTHLKVLIDNGDDVTLEWEDFGEADNVEITQEGNYVLTVNNENCSSRYSYQIKDYCPGKLYIPNSFTPNNDGLNDVFTPVSYGKIDNYELTIYNRWDNIVFFTANINEGWDGTFATKMQPNDVYVYKVSFVFDTQFRGKKKEEIVGTVTLFR